MRHYDYIEKKNPSVINGQAVEKVMAKILGIRLWELNCTHLKVGALVQVPQMLCVDGRFGDLVPNTQYPYIVGGSQTIMTPTAEEIKNSFLIEEGEGYILLYEEGQYLLVLADHAFSAV